MDQGARRGIDGRLLLLVWAALATLLAVRAIANLQSGGPLFADTDDAMRLVVVRDLLAGQGWFDHLQYRMNTPFGAEMHWSRWADLPLAALLLVSRPFLGANADLVAAFAVPLLLLLALLWLCARIGVALAGREAVLPALILPALSLSVLGEFTPGRIDHHSLQILMLLGMLWCAIEALARPRFAIGAGVVAATAIAIGIEGLPSVAAAILAFGLMWVGNSDRAPALRWFGLSFAAAAIVHLMLMWPPDRWLAPACDALSVTYVAAAVGVGAIFVGLSVLRLRSMWPRLAAGAVGGAALAVVLVVLFPQCLGGPYAALDPWLRANWIDKVTEAEPLWHWLVSDPVYPVAVLVPCLLALATTLWGALRGPPENRLAWLVNLVFLALAVATMLVQIRASRMATLVAVPACAALIVGARHWYLARRSIAGIGALALSWIASAGIIVAAIAAGITAAFPTPPGRATEAERTSVEACLAPAAYTDLAGLPPQRIMAPIDLGSHILAFTPHQVVGAPYHRNQAGVHDTFDFLNGPIEAARGILAARGITLVVVCPAMPEMRGLASAAPDSFVRLYRGQLPAWLSETSASDAALKVFAVSPR